MTSALRPAQHLLKPPVTPFSTGEEIAVWGEGGKIERGKAVVKEMVHCCCRQWFRFGSLSYGLKVGRNWRPMTARERGRWRGKGRTVARPGPVDRSQPSAVLRCKGLWCWEGGGGGGGGGASGMPFRIT